jgi:hypothetical protein
MISNFKKINDPKVPSLQGVQDNVRETFQPFITNPVLDGTLLEGVDLVYGPNLVEHKLDRPYRGFIVTKQPQGSEAEPWTTWTPTISADGSLLWTGISVAMATYSRQGTMCRLQFRLSGTLGGTAAGAVFIGSLPFAGFDNSGVGASLVQPVGAVWFITTVQDLAYCGFTRNLGFSTLALFRRDQSNYPVSGTLAVVGNIEYRINNADAYYGPGVSLAESESDNKKSFIRLRADIAGKYDLWVF